MCAEGPDTPQLRTSEVITNQQLTSILKKLPVLRSKTSQALKHRTSEALAVPRFTSTVSGAVGSSALPLASYVSRTPSLSAINTMSPLSSHVRATCHNTSPALEHVGSKFRA